MRLVVLCALFCMVGCGDDAASVSDAGSDAPEDAREMDSSPPDAAMDLAVADVASDESVDASMVVRCDDGLPVATFAEGERAAFDGVAGDFSAELLDGSTFVLSESFSGCDSYVFIARNRSVESESVWVSFPDGLFADSARNVHYFFVSEGPAATVRTNVEAMKENVEDSYTRLSAEDAAHWTERVHYVATPVNSIEGSVGELIRALGRVPTVLCHRSRSAL